MTYSDANIWLIIALLGLGTYLIRFSFLGLIGDRELPEWVLRHLRYVAVGVMPAIVAPLVVWPQATGGVLDAPRTIAAIAAFAIGIWTRSVIWSVLVGFGTLFVGLYFF